MARKETNDFAVYKDGEVQTENLPYNEAFEVASGVKNRIFPVLDENRPDLYDGDIYGKPNFTFYYDNDAEAVIREWSFSYHNDIQNNALKKVDYKVEKYLKGIQYLDTYRLYEYKINEQEAFEFLALTEEEQEDADYTD